MDYEKEPYHFWNLQIMQIWKINLILIRALIQRYKNTFKGGVLNSETSVNLADFKGKNDFFENGYIFLKANENISILSFLSHILHIFSLGIGPDLRKNFNLASS